MAALVNECRSRGVTLMFTAETESVFGIELTLPVRGISMLCENLLFLRSVEVRAELRRFISVLKLRTSGYDPVLRELLISNKGVEVGDRFDNAQLLMTGLSLESSLLSVPRRSRTRHRGK